MSIEFCLAYEPAEVDYSLWDRPWSSLPRASTAVDVSGSLAEAAMAGAEFLVPPGLRVADLSFGGYDLGLFVGPEEPAVRIAELDIVDRGGRVHWCRSGWTEISLAQALRSFERGTLPGDPRGIALMRPGRGAGGAVASWEAFLTVWQVLEGVLTAYSLYEIGSKLRRRISRGKESLEANLPDWRLRGAMTHSVLRLLGRRPWLPAALADLLDCSVADAVAVLELFGFTEGDDGRYHPGAEGAEGFLWALTQQIRDSYADSEPQVDALALVLAAQLDSVVRTASDSDAPAQTKPEHLP